MPILWIALAVAAVICWLLIRRIKTGLSKIQKRSSDPQAIVLLLEAPRPLSTSQVSEHFSRVTGRSFEETSLDEARGDANRAKDFIVTAPPSFLVNSRGTVFLINNVPKPYFNDAGKIAEATNELRLKQVITRHTAWLSVEILHPEAVSHENYRIVGQVTADLIGRDCLALFHPPANKLIPCNLDEVPEQLRSDDPIASVFGSVPYIPVVVTGDNPRLREAEDEARKRLPEFEAAFKSNSGSRFSVKVRLAVDDKSEHIWINVSEISSASLCGELGNHPVDLPGLHLGSKVEIDRSQVEDWVYRNTAGEPVGMFTVAILTGSRR